MNILVMLWGKTAAIVVGAVSLLIALLGIRHKIRKGAKNEMSAEIKERTLERIEIADRINRELAGADRDDILDKLREQGHLRD